MDKTATRLEVTPNALLLYKHPSLLDAAAAGVSDVMTLQGYVPNVGIYDSEDSAQAYTSLEHIAMGCDGSATIDARDYLEMIKIKTQLSDHQPDRVLAVTSQELSSERYKNILGASLLDSSFSVLSLASVMRSRASQGTQIKAVRHLFRRHYAMIEVMPFDSEIEESKGGLHVNHSNGLCTLNHINDVPDLLHSAEHLSVSDTAGFCAICLAKLKQKK